MSTLPTETKTQDVEHLNDVTSVAPMSRGEKTKRHCKRWWWAWLLGFGIFVMVVMLIVVYGVLPRVAQDKMNDSVLVLKSLKIQSPSPERFEVSMDSDIETGGGPAAHADLDPMEIELFLPQNSDPREPFMTMELPKLKGANVINVKKENYEVEVKDEERLREFAKTLMAEETFEFKIHGRTKIWLGKLNAKVNYDETVEMKGLNHLNGMIIKKYEPLLGEDDPTRNMRGEVLIPNPTVTTIEMGDVNLQIAVNGTHVGTGEIPNLVLTPGNNLYKFNALIIEQHLMKVLNAATAGTPLTIGSNGTYVDGQRIDWLSAPLEDLESQVPIEADH